MDSKTLATLAFLDAFGAKPNLLAHFADVSGPALWYKFNASTSAGGWRLVVRNPSISLIDPPNLNLVGSLQRDRLLTSIAKFD